jgi:hypothetical protein
MELLARILRTPVESDRNLQLRMRYSENPNLMVSEIIVQEPAIELSVYMMASQASLKRKSNRIGGCLRPLGG